MTTIALGFPFTLFLQFVLFPNVAILRPYANYLHRALISWCFCMHRDDRDFAADRTARPGEGQQASSGPALRVAAGREQAKYCGWKDFRVWWLLFVAIVWVIYGSFIVYRFRHPEFP